MSRLFASTSTSKTPPPPPRTNRSRQNTLLLGIASSSSSLVWWFPAGGATAVAVTLCEDNDDNKSFLDKIVKKDSDGNTDWAKSASQITDAEFWDTIATVSGEKVRRGTINFI